MDVFKINDDDDDDDDICLLNDNEVNTHAFRLLFH